LKNKWPASYAGKERRIAAGEFKAKCLAILDEVNGTGQGVVITKRGVPVGKLIPFEEKNVDSLFGRLKGIVEIVGDPDDLIKPIFPEEDWDMLK
jgi:prevent-host-death family protein